MIKSKFAVILTIILCVGAIAFIKFTSDNQAPVINYSGDVLNVTCSVEQEVMRGVSASDNEDGDISDKIFIENASINFLNQTNIITYVAIDAAGNVGKLTREIIMSSDLNKVIEIIKPLDITVNSMEEFIGTDYFRVVDKCGNDSTQLMLVSGEVDTNVIGEYPVTIKIDGKEEIYVINVVEKFIAPPTISLKEDKIEVELNENIDYMSYIDTLLDEVDDLKTLSKRVVITGQADTTISGSYVVEYSVSNTSSKIATASLEVIVK